MLSSGPMDRMVECELARIFIMENSDQQYIFLREKGGTREFPIIIALAEAQAIDRFVKGETLMRPLTHELLVSVVQTVGAKIDRVEVTEIREGTFYGNLVLRVGEEMHNVDTRPSDAIALAVHSGALIFVADAVLDDAAAQP